MANSTIFLHGSNGTYSFDHSCPPIGQGGMGVVFKGIDTKRQKAVAVKVLFSDLTKNPDNIQRLQGEAKAKFNHPNIVQMLDYVAIGSKHHVISEFVDGTTLSHQLDNGHKYDIRQAINITQQILNALSYLHQQGFVHRDVKPSNIIVTPQGAAKLMDLGIATNLQNRKKLTKMGNSPGTCHYMSPEHFTGDAGFGSDIYSMGITIYEMITGHVPFDGMTEYVIMQKHANDPLPPDGQIPAALFKILQKATAKLPSDRYADAMTFSTALLNWQAAKQLAVNPAPDPPTINNTERYINSIITILLAIILVMVVIYFLT